MLSAGASLNGFHRTYGSLRWRYFGPRTLLEDNSEQSKATSLFNLEAGYQLAKNVRVNLSVFNLFDAADADIDYFYVSRLPGEPAAAWLTSTPTRRFPGQRASISWWVSSGASAALTGPPYARPSHEPRAHESISSEARS